MKFESSQQELNKCEKSKLYIKYKSIFGLNKDLSERIAKSGAKKLIIVARLLFFFGIIKLLVDPVTRANPCRAFYFLSISGLSFIGFLYSLAVLKWRKMPHIFKQGLGVYGLITAIVLSIYNMYTSSNVVNGFLVLLIVMLLILTLANMEPMVFLCIIILPAFFFERELYEYYGHDLFMDVLIIFLIIVSLAFVLRRNLVVNYKQERRIIETSQNAIAADRAKSVFLARMSHEIRTPINAILGFDEMIIRESKEDVVRGYAVDIRNSGNTLLSVINDVLDFSRIEAGKMELYPVEYNMAFLINDLNNMIISRAQRKQLKIIHDINPQIPKVIFGDEVRIKQILLNLLTNAVKYTDDGSITIEVDFNRLDDSRGEFYFSIRDTGIGIKEEDLDSFFAPFERIEDVGGHKVEGTGLGIAICKELLCLMGSEMEVDSTFGVGSAFSFKLIQEVRNWEPIGDVKRCLATNEAIEEYQVTFTAREAKILAVDDMPVNLRVFTGLLKNTNMRIDTCTSGRECILMAQREDYDMVFLDHMMPDMDGIEVLHHLRTDNSAKYKETPIIILTANAVLGMREKYLEDGFTDYLSKPIIPERLEQMFINYLPKEKVILTGLVKNITNNHGAMGASKEYKSRLTVEFENLCRIPEFRGKEAAAAIGGKLKYVSAVKDFAEAIDEHVGRIGKCYKAGQFQGYSYEMSELRTALGRVGAYDLSEFARVLGQCADAGEVEIVMLRTEALTEGLNTLKEKIREAL